MQSHAPALLLFARQQSRSEEDAQDLLQEAIVESWERRPDACLPPLPLVYATIRRRAIDLARRNLRREGREKELCDPQATGWFDSAVEERERNTLLQQAMMKIPETHRQVVTLKIWGGLTFLEIAEALDIPANTAASRYRYGVEALRKELKGALI